MRKTEPRPRIAIVGFMPRYRRGPSGFRCCAICVSNVCRFNLEWRPKSPHPRRRIATTAANAARSFGSAGLLLNWFGVLRHARGPKRKDEGGDHRKANDEKGREGPNIGGTGRRLMGHCYFRSLAPFRSSNLPCTRLQVRAQSALLMCVPASQIFMQSETVSDAGFLPVLVDPPAPPVAGLGTRPLPTAAGS